MEVFVIGIRKGIVYEKKPIIGTVDYSPPTLPHIFRVPQLIPSFVHALSS